MKVLVIGAGGRCHAIIHALSKSKKVTKIYSAPGNAGIAALATTLNIKETEVDKLLEFAVTNKIDLTVVGPEAALEKGIVDAFQAKGLKIFGPTKAAAKIETSKAYAKYIMDKYNIPTASYKTFSNYEEAVEYVKNVPYPTVLKYDGLAAGKGVVIVQNYEEAKSTLYDMLVDAEFGTSSVVIEDYLTGPEFSFMCFVDNENVYPMQVSQDHKRAYDNDLGPNTGGMGAYSEVPIITDLDKAYALEHIMKPTALGLVKEGCPFKGVLYGGLMKTPNGIKVIEFNARFGDPETEVVLPKLKSDIYDVFCDIIDGNKVNLEWDTDFYLGIVMASKGYPKEYQKGYVIKNLESVNALVYHMGTAFNSNNEYVTNGGRVLMVVGHGASLNAAKEMAMNAVKQIDCENLFYRSDIGHWSL